MSFAIIIRFSDRREMVEKFRARINIDDDEREDGIIIRLRFESRRDAIVYDW